MLLPVCSLGVIPVLREMRRAGVSGGAILAFGLTAPLFNPISVLYGLTLADPIVILTFSFCSLVIVTVVGIGWDKFFPRTAAPEPEPAKVAFGAKRMLSIGVFGARELAGPSALYIAAGLLGVAVLSIMLPQGYLQSAAEPNDPWAPLFMTAISVPAYATPMVAMVQLASMFQHGNSVGAAFALLVLGAGANVGMIVWMTLTYGPRRTSSWFALLILIVVGLAYSVDKPLYPHGVEPSGHTHAFDIYCAPFEQGTPNAGSLALHELREKVAPHEMISLVAVGAFLAAGLTLAARDKSGRVEGWLEAQVEVKSRLDVIVPGPALGGVALVGLIALSVVGCYVYYPPPSEIFEEMRVVNTEVVLAASNQDWDTALYWIPVYDDWTRKLQVSMVLRGDKLTDYRRAKANVLRDKLELLEHEVENQEAKESRQLSFAVSQAYRRMRTAYANKD